MSSLKTWFMNLPPVSRLATLLGSVGVAGGTTAAAIGGSPLLAAAIVVGLVVALGLILLWKRLTKKTDKGVVEGLGDIIKKPITTTDEKRLKEELELREKFLNGVQVVRDAARANKTDLYHIPWYLVVGPPGSGKTEMIRRSGVQFSVDNMAQGEGGTYLMDWWPATEGIMVDSAGRLFKEGGSEWAELLKLLKGVRPRCPINGVLLVIGADRLLKGSEEELARDLQPTAKRLEEIQRILQVRYPINIIVTKADLIPGFKEYFEHVDSPVLQAQMLGWSDDVAIDDNHRFEPKNVDQLLASLVERVRKRRMALLCDLGRGERPGSRRVDLMDTLYELPDALERQVFPRLKRYLEVIFGQTLGFFATKPPFVRGVYFTSAMQQGKALDDFLAKMINLPVENLPQDARGWELNRAVFIRDLLQQKVFVEKGIVTQQADVGREVVMRRTAIIGSSMAAVLLLFAGLWFSYGRLKGATVDPVKQANQVQAATGDKGANTNVVTGKVSGEDDREGAIQTISRSGDLAQKRLNIGFPFNIFASVNKDLSNDLLKEERVRAQRQVVEMSVLKPLAEGVLTALPRTDAPGVGWNARPAGAKETKEAPTGDRPAVRALAWMLRTHALASGARLNEKQTAASADDLPKIEDFAIFLDAGSWKSKEWSPEQRQAVDEAIRTAFGKDARLVADYAAKKDKIDADSKVWPPRALWLDSGGKDRLASIVESYVKSWNERVNVKAKPDESEAARFAEFLRLLGQFGAAQAELDKYLTSAPAQIEETRDYARYAEQWRTQVNAMESAAKAIQAHRDFEGFRASASAKAFFDERFAQLKDGHEREWSMLRAALPADAGKLPESRLSEMIEKLDEIAPERFGTRLATARTSLDEEFKSGSIAALAEKAADGQLVVQERLAAYVRVRDEVQGALKFAPLFDYGKAAQDGEALGRDVVARVRERGAAPEATTVWKSPVPIASGVRVAFRKRVADAIDEHLTGLGRATTPNPFDGAAAALPQTLPAKVEHAQTPFVTLAAPQGGARQPQAAKGVLDQFAQVQRWAAPRAEDGRPNPLSATAFQSRLGALAEKRSEFVTAFTADWTNSVSGAMERLTSTTWTEIHRALAKHGTKDESVGKRVGEINAELAEALRVEKDAVATVAGGEGGSSPATDKSAALARHAATIENAAKYVVGLGEDPASAARALRAALRNEAAPNAFVSACDDAFDAPYWRTFFREALQVLASASSQELGTTARDQFQRDFGKFPVFAGERAEFTVAELKQAIERHKDSELLQPAEAKSRPALKGWVVERVDQMLGSQAVTQAWRDQAGAAMARAKWIADEERQLQINFWCWPMGEGSAPAAGDDRTLKRPDEGVFGKIEPNTDARIYYMEAEVQIGAKPPRRSQSIKTSMDAASKDRANFRVATATGEGLKLLLTYSTANKAELKTKTIQMAGDFPLLGEMLRQRCRDLGKDIGRLEDLKASERVVGLALDSGDVQVNNVKQKVTWWITVGAVRNGVAEDLPAELRRWPCLPSW